MYKKYFGIEEANKLIPLIKKKIIKLIKIRNTIAEITSIGITYDNLTYEGYINDIKINKEFHRISYEFYKELEILERSGCLVRDLDQGIVDFFSLFEGREVFLCWKLGEKRIRFWHEIDDNCNVKRPIYFLEKRYG